MSPKFGPFEHFCSARGKVTLQKKNGPLPLLSSFQWEAEASILIWYVVDARIPDSGSGAHGLILDWVAKAAGLCGGSLNSSWPTLVPVALVHFT